MIRQTKTRTWSWRQRRLLERLAKRARMEATIALARAKELAVRSSLEIVGLCNDAFHHSR
ncbi:hypothetical protein Sjap_010123 [Stephania japonica]|uniref:Uncharacterized protein n=1 Tax=Stephania japonica TaxID=461633 RepID=A0AAP0J8W3_9MAGN